ncbi:MAG: DUF2335 domain-containing protein [Patescibacteria group bacterium]|nr:DUF2335 domain-containing protein [Patescibacteria group bacterium]
MNKVLQNQRDPKGMVLMQHSKVESFSGPLPHPDLLKKFEEVVPGSAERIIKMAEEQSLHRKELESKVIDSNISRSKWGQILGFIIAIAGLIVACLVAIYGNAIAGGIIGVGTLASLVSVFMYGSKIRNSEENEEKK